MDALLLFMLLVSVSQLSSTYTTFTTATEAVARGAYMVDACVSAIASEAQLQCRPRP